MKCTSCGHTNSALAKFCEQCGKHFDRACPSCGETAGPDATFCSACGMALDVGRDTRLRSPGTYTPEHLSRAILRNRAAMEGERRFVTVLFADAAGFTSLSEKLDEEEVYDFMQGCTQCMMDAVHRYEGIVNQYLGDGIMALFGAPIAHEDSARRAIAAALDMQRSLDDYANEVREKHPASLRFRIGLNSGPVVVGSISDDLSMDYTAIGDTVNLAARMEELAEHGSVFLTENTYKAAREYFEFESLGALIVKGRNEPVNAYKALHPTSIHTRFEASTERGLTPYVGREHELAVLDGYLAQAQEGHGRVVFVSGEAGIGKSRLLLEFHKSLSGSPVRWIEGQCISFGKNIPYLPVVDLLRRNFGVKESDAEESIIGKVDRQVATWGAEARETVPYLKFMMSVDPGDETITKLDPAERRAGFFDGLRALMREEAKVAPLVMVVEDLHWVDTETEAALHVLVDTAASVPALMILTSRPVFHHEFGDRGYYSSLGLGHLASDESAKLAQGALESQSLPKDLMDLISRKAEGNPFYIEEVTKSLVETSAIEKSNGSFRLVRQIKESEVPETIQEVILSRIDRLDRESREALQLASVIGREFAVRLLKRISDLRREIESLLSELKGMEFIYEVGYMPELSYMFKHALTHDVAYSTLLAERRRMLHRVVGASIEELYAGRLPEHYETLAHHYSEAREWDKALDYLEKAGDKARGSFANIEAVDFYGRALEVCATLGKEASTRVAIIARKRANVNTLTGRFTEAIADLNTMRDAAQSLGDRDTEALALARRALIEWYAHDFDSVADTAREALDITGIVPTDTCLTAINADMVMCLTTGLYERAAELAPIIEDVAERLDVSTVTEDSYGAGAWAQYGGLPLYWEGEYDRALVVIEKWRKFAASSAWGRIGTMWTQALCLGSKGEYETALNLFRDAIHTGDRTGEVFVRIRSVNSIGWIMNEIQNLDEALDYNEEGIEVALAVDTLDSEVENNARLNLGDTLAALGRYDDAEKQYEQVGKIVRNPTPVDRMSYYNYGAHYFASFGNLCLLRGDPEQAASLADKCIDMAVVSWRKKNEIKGRRLKGQSLVALGEWGDAQNELTQALELARANNNPPQLWKTLMALGDLRIVQKNRAQALGLYREALSAAEAVANGLKAESLRESFLGSAEVSHIRKAADA